MKLGRVGLAVLFAFGGVTLVSSTPSEGAPQGRLLLPGPNSTTSGPINEIHEYCLESRGRRTLASFQTLPSAADICSDGFLYVADQTDVYKLDRLTGQVVGSFPHQTADPVSLACKPNGNLLIAPSIGSTIYEYTPPNWTRTNWVSNLIARDMRVTPQGTVAFLEIQTGDLSNDKLLEYDLAGNLLRTVLTITGDFMDSFVFSSASEILVLHRGSQCIKRYNWVTTPATFTSNFVCDAARVSPGYLAIHPVDGSVYSTSHVSACVYGWNPNGTLQYNGQPLGCYDPLLYVGRPIVLAEVCIPTLSEWGMIAMAGLMLLAGVVMIARRRPA